MAEKKKWGTIIIHCSDSTWGSASEIRRWHVENNNWSDVGYHFIILNGRIRPNFFIPRLVGSIEVGRQLDGDPIAEDEEFGAHALGYNRRSIGICLIGTVYFSQPQIDSLQIVTNYLQQQFSIPVANVLGHYEVDDKKTCPNLNMDVFRRSINPIGLLTQ